MSEVLRGLKDRNEYPIVFIGSGMSRRYLVDFPGWVELLKTSWDQVGTGKDFYGFLSSLKRHLSEASHCTDYELEYLTNIQAGSEVENKFNEKFYNEEITIPDFTLEKSYKFGISPYKMAVAKMFINYAIKNTMREEYEIYKAFLNKAQIIITTNYDTFIEDSINLDKPDGVKKYIGQKGFFEPTFGWAEIYKIHGCVSEPQSIVISKPDYDRFESNSILISAKIISMLIHSPIIFLGYSLTDGNVRRILRDFSSSLTKEEIRIMASKIIIVEREEGNANLSEQTFFDKDLGCEYTVIRTDNFRLLFEVLSEINQGIHPAEVRKYQHVIKELIVDRGKKGSLNTLLISPEELDDIERRIGDEQLVVALGDTAYIFQMPDLISYLYNYFIEERLIHTDIALRYIASQNNNSRIPFIKHVKDKDLDNSNLHPVDIEKIKQRVNKYSTPSICIDTIHQSYKIRAKSLDEIIEQNYRIDKEYDVIAYNALRIDKLQLERYIKDKLEKYKNDGVRSLSTCFRRLVTIYDLIENAG